MLVVDDLLQQYLLEEPRFRLMAPPQGVEVLVELQEAKRVGVVQPVVEDAVHQGQRERGLDLLGAELHLVEDRLQLVALQAVLGQLPADPLDQLDDLRGVLRLAALHPDREIGVADIVGVARAGEGLAELGVLQRLAQRRGGVVEQVVLQHRHGQRADGVGQLAGEEIDGHGGLALQLLLLADGIGDGQLAGAVPARLLGDLGVHRPRLVGGEVFLVQERQRLLHRDVSVGEEVGVGGMVVVLVEALEGLVAEGGDGVGVAAGVQPVGVVRQDAAHLLPFDDPVQAGVGALHLVVDDPLDRQRRADVPDPLEVQMVPLLFEMLLGEQRPEHGVAVDSGDVLEVLPVHAGAGVDGLVRVGHGVQETGQAGFQQLVERVFDGISRRAAQRRVLQDVRQPAVVRRRRLERHREQILRVVGRQVQQPRPAALVPQEQRRHPQPRQGGDLLDREPMDLILLGKGCGGCVVHCHFTGPLLFFERLALIYSRVRILTSRRRKEF